MPLRKSEMKFSDVRFFYLAVVLAIAGGCLYAAQATMGAGETFLSKLIQEKIWRTALDSSGSHTHQFHKGAAKVDRVSIGQTQRVAVLVGVSGKAVVRESSIPVLKFQVPGSKSARVFRTGFIDKIAIGDTISITTVDGKRLHFRVKRLKQPEDANACGDINAPQKDTELLNCMSFIKKNAPSEQYILEAVEFSAQPPAPEGKSSVQQQRS